MVYEEKRTSTSNCFKNSLEGIPFFNITITINWNITIPFNSMKLHRLPLPIASGSLDGIPHPIFLIIIIIGIVPLNGAPMRPLIIK